MGDENPIRTLGDYSKPSHEGYRNTIKLPVGNNVVPLRSDTIRSVQNRCSFHGLWSEDPNQQLKDFLKLVDSLDLDGENRERTRMEEAKFPVTKNVNSISLAKGEEERSDKMDETLDNTVKPTVTEIEIPVIEAERSDETKNKLIKKAEREEGPSWEGDLKHVNALVDQGSDVNVMPYSTYMKLTDKRPAETNIRLSLASHSYIYPLGIVEDVLVEFTEHVYPVDFVILDIKENEKRPFILGIPFLTTAKATIKFDKGTITLRSGKSK
ncbi:MAK10-like protein, partial [Tanacetum coccineum]